LIHIFFTNLLDFLLDMFGNLLSLIYYI